MNVKQILLRMYVILLVIFGVLQVSTVEAEVTCLPISNWTDTTTAGTFCISSVADLETLRDNVNDPDANNNNYYYETTGITFVQTNNIDLSTISNWTPIGNDSAQTPQFEGTYNGDGYTISNLALTTSTNGAGLFGYTYGATLTGITLENVNINSSLNELGSLIGKARQTNISNIVMKGSMSIESSNIYGGSVGGLVGSGEANSISNINATLTELTVRGYNAIGGLIGDSVSDDDNTPNTISNSSMLVTNLTLEGNDNVGGFVGKVGTSTIENTFLEVSDQTIISGVNDIGAFVGHTDSSTSTTNQIVNSYSKQNDITITSTGTNIGGFAGYNEGEISESYLQFDTLTVDTSSTVVGGFVGLHDGTTHTATISNSYVAGNSFEITNTSGSGYTLIGLQKSAVPPFATTDYSFSSIKTLSDNVNRMSIATWNSSTSEGWNGSYVYYMNQNTLTSNHDSPTTNSNVDATDLIDILATTGYQSATSGTDYYPVLSDIASTSITKSNQPDTKLYWIGLDPTYQIKGADFFDGLSFPVRTDDTEPDWLKGVRLASDYEMYSGVVTVVATESVDMTTPGDYTITYTGSGVITNQVINPVEITIHVIDPDEKILLNNGSLKFGNGLDAEIATRDAYYNDSVYKDYPNQGIDILALDPNFRTSDLVNPYLREELLVGTSLYNSIDENGNLKQPWYYNGDFSTSYGIDSPENGFVKLTYSYYPMNSTMKIDNSTTYHYNDVNLNVNDIAYDLRNYDSITETGVLLVKGYLVLGDKILRITHEYSLDKGVGFLKTTTTFQNISNTINNLKYYVGTGDNWLGVHLLGDTYYNSDYPNMQRGTFDISSALFESESTPSNFTNAVEISTDNESAYFFTTSMNEDTTSIIAGRYMNQLPTTLGVTSITNDDGSYSLGLDYGSLTPYESVSADWYYIAGDESSMADTLVALSAAVNNVTTTETTASVDLSNTSTGTGYQIVVPYGSTAPTDVEIAAGVDYSGVTIVKQGSEAITTGSDVSLSFDGLDRNTKYDLYFVPKVNTTYGDIVKLSFITKNDITAPVFDNISDQKILVSDTDVDWTTFIKNATDNSGEALTLTEVSDAVTYGTVGTYSVTVSATDNYSNTTTKTFSVTVETAPVVSNGSTITTIELQETHHIDLEFTEVTIELGDEFVLPTYDGYKLYGYYETDLTSDVVVTSNVDQNKVGTYEVLYTLTAYNEHTKETDVVEEVYTVHIVDQTAPIIIGDEATEALLEGEFVAEVTCTDNAGACVLTSEGEVDTSKLGTYEITYTGVDTSGNTIVWIQTVTVRIADSIIETVTLGGEQFVFPLVEHNFDLNDYTITYYVSTEEVDGTESGWKIYANQPIERSVEGEIIYIKIEDSYGNRWIKASTPYHIVELINTDVTPPKNDATEAVIPDRDLVGPNYLLWILLGSVLVSIGVWWFVFVKMNDDEEEKESEA